MLCELFLQEARNLILAKVEHTEAHAERCSHVSKLPVVLGGKVKQLLFVGQCCLVFI